MELVERLRWWGAKRKAPKGMDTLPSDCREAADRIEELERQLAEVREANRKLHRRAQLGEGLFAAVKFDLEMWLTTLSSPPRDTSSWLFRYALRHMERSVSRHQKKIDVRALSDSTPTLLQEQKDNAASVENSGGKRG